MPTNLFKLRWFNKAINAIFVQGKQPLVLYILHVDRTNFGTPKSEAARNQLTKNQKLPSSIRRSPETKPNKPYTPLPQLLTDPHKNAQFPASQFHLDP